ncbi:MAG: mercuric reductase [Candidatus Angelobacter sp.]|nr:mercuric reductase [Candidatus Angelobacter sp.]
MTPPHMIEVKPADEFNKKLVENAHPPDWVNPRPEGRYNLVVVGAGTAGLVAAAGAAILGARVALIERHLTGGDCLNYGCVPSKALIRSARAAHAVEQAREFGIETSPAKIEFADVMRRVRRVRADIAPNDSVQRFARLGVDVFLGHGHFTGKRSLEVEGQRLDFRKAIIATGARASVPPIPGLAEAGYLTNETVFSLTARPRRLIVIGGGPIACELAQAFARLGSRVSLVSDIPRLLPKEDADVAALLEQQFRQDGIDLLLGAKVERAEKSAVGKILIIDRGQTKETVVGDEILLAVGRTPNVEGLNLEAAGVKYDHNGVTVDDHLRTTNRSVFAAGDIASQYHFTHAAEALGRIALQNALFFGRKRASNLVIPWCTYTDPEVAHVGLNEESASKSGIEIETFTLPFAENDRAVVDADTQGFARVHVRKKDGRLFGATLVCRHAGESIGELVIAIQRKMKIGDLSAIIHPYPTEAEIIKRLGDASQRGRLKPWMKQALVKMFQWRR